MSKLSTKERLELTDVVDLVEFSEEQFALLVLRQFFQD